MSGLSERPGVCVSVCVCVHAPPPRHRSADGLKLGSFSLFSILLAASCVPEMHLDPQGIWIRAEAEEQRKCSIVINLPHCKTVVSRYI